MLLYLYCFVFFYLAQSTIQKDVDYKDSMAYAVAGFGNEYESSISANCTNVFMGSAISCNCFDCSANRCTLCCTRLGCCQCYTCDSTKCRDSDWEMVTITQLIMSSVLFLGIIITIILFFKVCQRSIHTEQSRSDLLTSEYGADNVSINSMQRYILERLQDRPPRYNEIYDAPPLYNSGSSRAAMSEAPPVYERSSEAEDTGHSVISSRTAAQGQTNILQQLPVAHYI